MHVFVTGASGLLGKYLVGLLEAAGHQVTGLTRKNATGPGERVWDPSAEALTPSLLEGCESLVHLAGESIADGRWSTAKKQKIRESRVHSTRLLAEAFAAMETPPKSFIVASAIGYYGDRSDEVLTEQSSPGTGFLPEVCEAWEAAADPARAANIRTVHVRTGIVLAKEGGALKAMLTPFKMGVGGIMGNGRQYWSWISLEDIARMFQFAVENEDIAGPINGTSPTPCTNLEFTKALGKAISRPTIFPMPAFAAKIVLGEMAEALILASARVIPEQAEKHNFEFIHADLADALASLKL